MHLPSAFLLGLLFGGANAQFRAMRRDSGVCSMEIVATVTRTYTITTSEEVVVPCKTADGKPLPVPSADDSSPSPESPSKPGRPVDKLDPKLPFVSLIPDDYFPDVTYEDPPAAATSTVDASSSTSSPASPSSEAEKDSSDASTTKTASSAETSSVSKSQSGSPDELVTPANPQEDATPSATSEVSSSTATSDPVETEPADADPDDDDDSEDEDSEEDDSEGDDTQEEEPQTEPVDEDPATDEPEPVEPEPSNETTSSIESAVTSATETSEEPQATTTTSSSSTTVDEPAETTFIRNYPADVVDNLRDESMEKLREHLKRQSSSCTLENAAVRYEWSDLSIPEREDYLRAVQCLQKAPAKTPSNIAAGAKSRFDDFVVTHVQQTNRIHNTANFLSWHRYFTWAYETALRDECGYKGYQPYWNWDRYANDPANSPIFNGNATSFGGNSVNNECAPTGAFDELTVNVGPGNRLGYNPRCVKRSVSRHYAQQCTADKTMAVIRERDITGFQNHMQYHNGIHAGGHFTIGGDPGGDVYTSPGDPVFHLHHAMIDRVWWIWQLQDLDSRLTAVAGNVGGGSNRPGTLQDEVDLGHVGGGVLLGELLDTMGGKQGDFCYIYA